MTGSDSLAGLRGLLKEVYFRENPGNPPRLPGSLISPRETVSIENRYLIFVPNRDKYAAG